MQFLKSIPCILGLLCLFQACQKNVDKTSDPQTNISETEKITTLLDREIPKWQTELNIPNVGIGLIEDGKIVKTKVYGKLPDGTPAPENMLFNLASVTKIIVATLTMKLIEKGEWDLDEPLFNYHIDPDVVNDPYHKKITTRHVLSQQSGFANWRWNHPSEKLTFEFEPGTNFQYSGEGMEYLRKSLEKKFDKTLSELANEILFTPLGMKDSSHEWDGKKDLERFSRWYDTNGKEHDIKDYSTIDNAADDFMTTVEDLTQFGLEVLNGAGLSQHNFAEMVKTQAEINPNLQQGLGWRVINNLPKGEYAIQHGGNDIGVAALIVLLPKSKRGLVVFTNSDSGLFMCNNVVRAAFPEGRVIIHKSYKSTGIDEMPVIVEVDTKTLKAYEGTFTQPSGRQLKVNKTDKGLNVEMPGIPKLTFFPSAIDTFFLLDFDSRLAFSTNTEGVADTVYIIDGDNVIACPKMK